jgi:hypothetical protein
VYDSYWGVGRVSEVVSYASAYYLYIAMTLAASILALVLWQVDLRIGGRQLAMTSHELAEDSMLNTKDENELADEMRHDLRKKHNVPVGLVHPWERISNRVGTNVYDEADWNIPTSIRDWWQPADGPRTMPIRRRPRTPMIDEDDNSGTTGTDAGTANPKTPLLRPKTPLRGGTATNPAEIAALVQGMTAVEAAEALKGAGLMNYDFMRTMSDPTMRYGALLQGSDKAQTSPPPPVVDRAVSTIVDAHHHHNHPLVHPQSHIEHHDSSRAATTNDMKKHLTFDGIITSPISGALTATAPPGVDPTELREWQLNRAPETEYGYHSMEMDEDRKSLHDPLRSLHTNHSTSSKLSSSSSTSTTNSSVIPGRPP